MQGCWKQDTKYLFIEGYVHSYIKYSNSFKFYSCGKPKLTFFKSEVAPVPQETYCKLSLK